MKTSWHVATSAEAFAAAQFARCGWDVSVQYGANQPEYDLIVDNGSVALKISVKGSKDGSWGLTQSLLTKGSADYHSAIDAWLARHGARTALCLVQFKGVPVTEMPRMYLATPIEIATRLRSTASGRGDTILYERKVWTSRAHGAGTTDEIPSNWRFDAERIQAICGALAGGVPQTLNSGSR
jgi:Holliday junction resolvase-like predicted endonuclease